MPALTAGTAARFAPAAFVLLWSTGFIGARYGLPYAEPFTLLSIRLALASVLLMVIARLLRQERITSLRQARGAAAVGILMHSAYLGGVFWAIDHGLPVSIAALIASMQPVVVAAASGPLLRERLTASQWAGIALGLGGVMLVLAPGLLASSTTAYPTAAALAAVVALAGSAGATLLQKRIGASVPMVSGAAVQYAAGAVVLLALAVATESRSVEWSPAFVGVLAWMVMALSIGAILLMLWLLSRGSAASVASLYFLVPPVTLMEAAILFGERLPAMALVGFGVATAGVALAQRPRGLAPAAS